MAQLTVSTYDRTGLDLTGGSVAANAGGDSFPNDGATFFWVENGGGGSITVTFALQSIDGQSVTGKSVTVAAGKRFLVGPFPQTYYNDSSGLVQVTYSGVTTVKVLPVKKAALA